MDLDRITIEHFGIFTDPVELPLANQGLVLVRGENRLSQSADSNGSGKSAIFSALSWVLYGVTLPGPDGKMLKGEEVACRFSKAPCRVTLTGSEGETVVRGQRPSGLYYRTRGVDSWTTAGWADRWPKVAQVRDEAEISTSIAQAVGHGAVTFRNAVVFGQGVAERLATADQAQYLKMLDEIQGLDFRAALDRAKAWRDEWRETAARLDDEHRFIEDRRQVGMEQARELEAALASFAEGKKQRIKQWEETVRFNAGEVKQAEEALAQVQEKGKRAAALRVKWNRVMELREQYVQASDANKGNERVFNDAQFKVQQIVEDTEALVHEARCPTCRREIAGKVEVARIKKLFAPDLQAAQKALAEAESKLKATEIACTNLAAVLDRHLKALPGVDERVVALAEAEGGPRAQVLASTTLTSAQAREQQARENLAAEKKRAWEGQAALDAARKQVSEAGTALIENAREQQKARRTILAAEYWVEAFGDRGLRSLMFESVADYLNERLAHHLEILTAGEADVQVSALSALKSGKMKEKLSVNASWAWGAGSYGAGSAGQSGRVNLALLFAHQDLAEHRSARPFSLRVLDEPECHIDARGQEILAEWIQREAARRSTTFLVTHNPILAELVQPDHVWTVVLDRQGARVEIA